MSKAFWEGFRKGFLDASKYGIPLAAAFAIVLVLAHPYEECKRKYVVERNDE